jgi:hypothetical protein
VVATAEAAGWAVSNRHNLKGTNSHMQMLNESGRFRSSAAGKVGEVKVTPIRT